MVGDTWNLLPRTILVQSCNFNGNKADLGGAINVNQFVVSIVNSSFVQNMASTSGGGLYLQWPAVSVQVSGSYFESNSAVTAGGGIYIQNGTNAVLTNSIPYIFHDLSFFFFFHLHQQHRYCDPQYCTEPRSRCWNFHS
jgi:predicted outer membrane repeat protein